MADKITVMQLAERVPGIRAINVIFWMPAAGTPLPLPGYISKYPDIDGPTLAEIRAGTLIEELFTMPIPATYSNAEITEILLRFWTGRAAAIAAGVSGGEYYGAKCSATDQWSLP